MIDYTQYRDGDAADLALVAQMATEQAQADTTAAAEGEGWLIQADGHKLDWTDRLPRPTRRTGTRELATPTAFANYVDRLAVDETTIYADKSTGAFDAVFDDHPAVTDGADAQAPAALAGWGRHHAALKLAQHEDWNAWLQADGRPMDQRTFGEFVETYAHTVVEPSAATMLEVALTLTAKRSIDFDSRARLDNGDMSFKFTEETQARAGRSGDIEIPTSFRIELPVWEGTPAVSMTLRLRVRGGGTGVVFIVKALRRSDVIDEAFATVVDMIDGTLEADIPIFLGSA